MPNVNRSNEACLSADALRATLLYDPDHGVFYKRRGGGGRKAGEKAGCVAARGYVRIAIHGTPYLAHRLAFLYMTGAWPRENVDHLNGDPSDNRWCNLVDRPQSENVARARRPTGCSGIRGVCFKARGWEASIKVRGRTVYLGRFQNAADAAEAYRAACVLNGRDVVLNEASPEVRKADPPKVAMRAISPVAAKPMVTPEDVARVFSYDPDTGTITRKVAARGAIHPVGSVAGSIQREWGYRIIKIRCRGFLAHRLAWVLMTGEWPTLAVDHINGQPDDNRWCNLRLADASQNAANRKVFATNKLGRKGVFAVGSCYGAVIHSRSERRFLGRFDTADAASAAYEAAARSLHGEFMRAT